MYRYVRFFPSVIDEFSDRLLVPSPGGDDKNRVGVAGLLAHRGHQAFRPCRAGLLMESVQSRGQRIDPGGLLLQSADLSLLLNHLFLLRDYLPLQRCYPCVLLLSLSDLLLQLVEQHRGKHPIAHRLTLPSAAVGHQLRV